MAQAKVTTDHDTIRRWAEERGGKPAAVRSTHSAKDRDARDPDAKGRGGRDEIGIIRIEFPGAPRAKDENLVEISWDEFFTKFDEANLALLYQEETARGEKSNFSKLVGRETAEARQHGEHHASRHGSH